MQHAEPESYRRLLSETLRLYRDSAQTILREHPELAPAGDFNALMVDLHRGVCLRIYLTICEADRQWSTAERRLATELCDHLWRRRLEGPDLSAAMREASQKARELSWRDLIGPFARLAPLRDRVAELETLIVRQANLVARADGVMAPTEQRALRDVVAELHDHLAAAQPADAQPADVQPADRVAWPSKPAVAPPDEDANGEDGGSAPARPLEEVLAELDGLVGLASVKREVRSLANYITMQKRRIDAGLPSTDISLHMVFTGNPGTGKTTVARLVGEALHSIGVLEKGQLIETDRSGLVAQYAGQTAPRTNEKVDEALDGVLFIDEAYGLVGADGDDPFGREAVQTLLKRAEDDRERLAVILAGYPVEMDDLLAANPGLNSRFSRRIAFDDYGPLELCQIFGRLIRVHQYELSPAGRLRVVQAITDLHATRDRHFGNGRTVRNLFERAILQMANRLAGLPEVTTEQLVTLEANDIPMPDTLSDPASTAKMRFVCAACGAASRGDSRLLGRRAKCRKCGEAFDVEWGELDDDERNRS